MSNEEYWMIHEMGEAILGSDDHFCSYMGYKRDKLLKDQLVVSKRLMTMAYILLMDVLDEKQKRGRLIVGGKVSE